MGKWFQQYLFLSSFSLFCARMGSLLTGRGWKVESQRAAEGLPGRASHRQKVNPLEPETTRPVTFPSRERGAGRESAILTFRCRHFDCSIHQTPTFRCR